MIQQPAIKYWIVDFLKSRKCWFNSSDIKDFISERFKVKIPNNQIVDHLNSKHNLSYKKGNPRPIELDTKRIEQLKTLYCIKIAKQMSKVKLLINIDKTTINKDTTKWYSCLTRGKSWSILNVKFKILWISFLQFEATELLLIF